MARAVILMIAFIVCVMFWQTGYENYEVLSRSFVDTLSEEPEGRMSRIQTRRPKLQMTNPTE